MNQDDDEPPPKPVQTLSFRRLHSVPFSARSEKEKSVVTQRSRAFMHTFFPGITEKEWTNWHWQIRHSVRTTEQLTRFIHLSENEISIFGKKAHTLPLRITPYYLSLIDRNDPEHALRKAFIPVLDELISSTGELLDPLSEEHHSPAPNIVHRYPDRVLFLATGFCSAYCRYCTRTHMVAKEKCHVGIKAWEPGLRYIEEHEEVRDVIISGGDPLTMPDQHIEYLLSRLRRIGHLEIIRIGTKVPVVLPQRITRSLLNILKKYHPLFMSIHFTHPDELTPEVKEACEQLANAGIPLGSQTVLLKGINDEVETMKKLFQGLLRMRVRPYYIYQCDPVPGSGHFRTTISKGLEIIRGLRGHTSGYAVPQYVIDAPGGGGKIPLLPEYYKGHENGYALLENYEGRVFRYPDYIQ
ncbi:MAG: KamA family radical SAM protein [Bacteroidetes bacterium]|nr:MAG: KamA family radical SAM protein [Bacteroidota bacterium]